MLAARRHRQGVRRRARALDERLARGRGRRGGAARRPQRRRQDDAAAHRDRLPRSRRRRGDVDGIAMARSGRARRPARLPAGARAGAGRADGARAPATAGAAQGLARRRASPVRSQLAAAVDSEADRRIGTLSKGFRQRVGLADALLGEPPLLDPRRADQRHGSDPDRASCATPDRRAKRTRGAGVEPRGRATSRRSRRASRCCATASSSRSTRRPRCASGRQRLEDAVVALLGEAAA